MDETLLKSMAVSLEILAGVRQVDDPNKPKPGFAPLPKPKKYRTIYAKRDGDFFWHMLSEEVNPRTGKRSKIPLTGEDEQSFIGRLSNIEIVETTRKDENSQDRQVLKAYIVLEGDIPTKIETNPETGFFRSFVAIASSLTPEQFSKSIQIVPTPAKAAPGKVSFETVMWCDIFDPVNGMWCRGADWSKRKYSEIPNWDDRIDSLITHVRQLNGNTQANGVMSDPKRYMAEAEDGDSPVSEPLEPITPASLPTQKQSDSPEPVDLSELITASSIELDRVGWTAEQGRAYIKETYKKNARPKLNEAELTSFVNYLRSLPTNLSET